MAEVALGSSQAAEDSLLKNRPLLSQSHELLQHPREHGRQCVEQKELQVRIASDKGGMVCAGLGLGGLTWDGAPARTVW